MPLLFWRRLGLVLLIALGLTACGAHRAKSPPSFTASGYIADRGAMRIWRKDDQAQNAVTIESVFSPYQGGNTVITHYQFIKGDIRQINRTQSGDLPENVQIRFDDEGNVSFMQRQRNQQREKLSDDEVALYKFEASRQLDISQSLRAGRVALIQGEWRNGTVYACDGSLLKPDFDNRSMSWILSRAKRSNGQLGLAWLNAPEGTQLLLVANDDFCRWQPKKSEL